jgi:hypothetical protein
MPDYLLTPPTFEEGFTLYDRPTSPLWRYMHSDQGMSLVKQSGTWSQAQLGYYPDLSVLDAYYQGGRSYVVDEETANDLIADGLGDYLTPTPSAYARLVITDEPLVYYHLDELVDPTAVNAAGAGLDGVLFSNPVAGLVAGEAGATQSGPGPSGLVFYLDTSPSEFITGVTEWSIEAWVEGSGTIALYVSSAVINCITGFLSESPVPGGLAFVCRSVEDPVVNFYAIQESSPWDDGNPHHLVGTFDGETMRLYVDGTEAASEPFAGTLTADLVVAQQAVDGPTTFDGFAFYDHALSPARVLAHYEAGSA